MWQYLLHSLLRSWMRRCLGKYLMVELFYQDFIMSCRLKIGWWMLAFRGTYCYQLLLFLTLLFLSQTFYDVQRLLGFFICFCLVPVLFTLLRLWICFCWILHLIIFLCYWIYDLFLFNCVLLIINSKDI